VLDGAGAIVTGVVEELLGVVGCEIMATLEEAVLEGCADVLEGVLTTIVVGLWLDVLETIREGEELDLTVLDCAAEEEGCTLELDVDVEVGGTTTTVVELVVVLGNAFPLTATSLAPQTFAFTRTSPTAFFK